MLSQSNVSDQRATIAPAPAADSWLRPATIATAAVCGAWLVGLALVLRHSIFVTNDSLNNYAHVWYVSDALSQGHRLPLHMPVLAHGDAYAFPYGFIPWLSAALLRPLFGDWIVTLWLVAGFAGTVAAMWWAFPELRRGWWFALLLAEPMLVESVLLGQLPFLWATALLFAAIACWRRDARVAAAILFGLAQATHPAVMMPIAAVLVAARLYWEPARRRLLVAYAMSLAIAAPAVWLVLASPTVGDSSNAELAGNFFGTVSLRAIVVAAPFIALVLQRTPFVRVPAALLAILVGANLILVPIRHNEFAWTALARDADTTFGTFVDSDAFVPNATYRLLRTGDGKVGMYQILKGGGRLDSEFFPESIDRRSWPDAGEYAGFLEKRHVDYVVIFDGYDRRYRTNEHQLLQDLAAGPGYAGLCVQRVERVDDYDVYQISRCERVFAGAGT